MPEETSKGLGAPKTERIVLTSSLLRSSTSLFHWEYVSSSLTLPSNIDEKFEDSEPQKDNHWTHSSDGEEDTGGLPPFNWVPPDLSVGGKWFLERVSSLRKAAAGLPYPEKVILEGLELLDIHCGNYDAMGPKPKRLQLLWWEFPKEHWTPLREGSRMNFLKEPKREIHDNAVMDDEQLDVAAAFVDELLDLGIVLEPSEGEEVLSNSPLFTVPKEGQEGP